MAIFLVKAFRNQLQSLWWGKGEVKVKEKPLSPVRLFATP